MHIVDGVLSPEILIAGGVVSTLFVAIGLKQLTPEKTPQAALFCAVFFVASLIHLPAFLTASSVHLILSGLMGITLGWAVFPAVAIAILLQAVFFGYGGILVLGVNVFNIAFPALLVGLAFRKFALNKGLTAKMLAIIGGLGGGVSIIMSGCLVASALSMSGESFQLAAKLVLITNVPVAIVEAFVSGFAVYFLMKAKPDFFVSVMQYR